MSDELTQSDEPLLLSQLLCQLFDEYAYYDDSYCVDGSDFNVCSECGAENGAGVLRHPFRHAEDCQIAKYELELDELLGLSAPPAAPDSGAPNDAAVDIICDLVRQIDERVQSDGGEGNFYTGDALAFLATSLAAQPPITNPNEISSSLVVAQPSNALSGKLRARIAEADRGLTMPILSVRDLHLMEEAADALEAMKP